MQARMLIVDDHHLVRRGLMLEIGDTFPELDILEASCVSSAMSVSQDISSLDMALIDLNMRGADGRQLLPVFRNSFPQAKLVMISGQDDIDTVNSVISAGANGFISKGSSIEDMMEDIGLYLEGTLDFNKGIKPILVEAEPQDSLENYGLTCRELEIAQRITQGLNNKEISAEVHLSEGTVKNYASMIFEKLGVSTRTQLLVKFKA